MQTVALLERLSNGFGPPAFETEIREIITEAVEPLVDSVEADALGNLIARRSGSSGKTIMVDAHMDEVGFMISHIEQGGFLRLAPLGSWDTRILPSHAVTVKTREGARIRGVIGSKPPHILSAEERRQPHSLEDLFVDIGAESAEEVAGRGLRVGDPATIFYPFEQADDNVLMGKAFDDRAGCAAAIGMLEELRNEELPCNLVVNFATSEELGLRGARTAAFQIDPDWALALEGTVAADVPGVPEARQPSALGKGPAISVADRSVIVPPDIVRLLEELAEELEMPYQHKTPLYGSTNAGAISLSRGGVRCGVLSVPCRYIHAPISLMRRSDFEHTVRLTTAFVRAAPGRLMKHAEQVTT